MALPLDPPLLPQLARSRSSLPEDDGTWAYEPKWDGFRCIAFVDGDGAQAYLQSRSGKPLRRYFPELVFPDGRYVVDGEIVLFDAAGDTQFDLLGQRIHPAKSRVEMLSVEHPATFVAFDLLAHEDEVLIPLPYVERRAALEELIAAPLQLTPMVLTTGEAKEWLHTREGVIAKERAAVYQPGERKGMVKVKRVRTIDAVLVGWRPGKAEGTLGALILGLYTPEGELRVVGHSSGFTAKEKRELPGALAPFESGERGSGDPSRWKSDKELEWIGLRPELVVEVTFDQVSDGRIRHGAKVARWREDKPPAQCTVDQLDS
jgi:ATP-dependent DNA ligase